MIYIFLIFKRWLPGIGKKDRIKYHISPIRYQTGINKTKQKVQSIMYEYAGIRKPMTQLAISFECY